MEETNAQNLHNSKDCRKPGANTWLLTSHYYGILDMSPTSWVDYRAVQATPCGVTCGQSSEKHCMPCCATVMRGRGGCRWPLGDRPDDGASCCEDSMKVTGCADRAEPFDHVGGAVLIVVGMCGAPPVWRGTLRVMGCVCARARACDTAAGSCVVRPCSRCQATAGLEPEHGLRVP